MIIALLFFANCNMNIQKQLAADIEKFYHCRVEILKSRELPKNAYYVPRNRYRAEKIIAYLNETEKKGTLAITNRDLSTTAHGVYDWGICGMGSPVSGRCIMSTYRLRNRNQILNVALHEIGHGKGLNHCKNECLMRDAHGKVSAWESLPPKMCEKCRRLLFG